MLYAFPVQISAAVDPLFGISKGALPSERVLWANDLYLSRTGRDPHVYFRTLIVLAQNVTRLIPLGLWRLLGPGKSGWESQTVSWLFLGDARVLDELLIVFRPVELTLFFHLQQRRQWQWLV